jgi:hypothetical protein
MGAQCPSLLGCRHTGTLIIQAVPVCQCDPVTSLDCHVLPTTYSTIPVDCPSEGMSLSPARLRERPDGPWHESDSPQILAAWRNAPSPACLRERPDGPWHESDSPQILAAWRNAPSRCLNHLGASLQLSVAHLS